MGLQLEVGKYYRTRDGRKVELLAVDDGDWNGLPLKVRYPTGNLWLDKDGIMQMPRDPDDDLIAEWTDAPTGPVRTVTRTTREIVPGEYDGLDVGRAVNGTVFLAMPIANHCQESIDAIIANLKAIRDALEDV